MSFNISLLPAGERRVIELQRQAALLINELKKSRITRGAVQTKISELPENEHELFKEFLNKYKVMK